MGNIAKRKHYYMYSTYAYKCRSVERGVQGVPQVPGPNFSGGPKFWKLRTLLLYIYTKMKEFLKWIDLAFLLFFYIIIY